MDGSNVMARVRERVDTWLAEFEEALAVRDIERVAGLFATSSFWRDLIAFTWNIATVEGREGVAELLRTTLDATGPWGFRTTEEPTEAGGVVEAWPVFETAVGRGQRAHHPELIGSCTSSGSRPSTPVRIESQLHPLAELCQVRRPRVKARFDRCARTAGR